jgi:hypothetical protein
MLLTMKTPIVVGAPTLPGHYLLYAIPFVLISLVAVLGVGRLRVMRDERQAAPIFWLATILGLECYAVFTGSEMGLTLAYRTLNFLWPPLAILSAAGLRQLYETPGRLPKQRSAKLAAIVMLIAIASLNSYNVYAAVSLQERYMGYWWLYKAPEFRAGTWIAMNGDDRTVAGDGKISPLLKGYFCVDVDMVQGLRYLTGKGGSQPQMLLVYDQMLKKGYVLGPYSVDLPENWVEKASQLNLVYSNGQANLYAS